MCTYKRHVIISVIIYLTVLTGLGIGLVLNFVEKEKVDKYEKPQFNTTYFTIVGYGTYTGPCEVCHPNQYYTNCWDVPGFFAYARLKYLAWFNNTLSEYKGITHGDGCDPSQDTILYFVKTKYPLGSQFIGYYNKSNPLHWRKHLPEYSVYERNLLSLLIFMFIAGVLMIFHGMCFTLWYCKNKDEIKYVPIENL